MPIEFDPNRHITPVEKTPPKTPDRKPNDDNHKTPGKNGDKGKPFEEILEEEIKKWEKK